MVFDPAGAAPHRSEMLHELLLREDGGVAANIDSQTVAEDDDRKREFVEQVVGGPLLAFTDGFVVDTSKAAFVSDGSQETS